MEGEVDYRYTLWRFCHFDGAGSQTTAKVKLIPRLIRVFCLRPDRLCYTILFNHIPT